MKADIPDSIIISRDEDGILHHSYWTTDQQLVPFEATEFIRKEALLEWAKVMHGIYLKRYEGSTCTCGEHWGQMVAFQRMIDKLNQM